MSSRTMRVCNVYVLIAVSTVFFLAGCGGGGGSAVTPAPPPAAIPDFSLVLTPSTLTFPAGGAAQFIVVPKFVNGFSETVSVVISGSPIGMTVTPSTFELTKQSSQTVTVTSVATASEGDFNLSVSGASGGSNHQYTVATKVVNPLTLKPPLRTTYLDVGYATYNFVNGCCYPGWQISLADPARKLFFASITFGNQVVAVSAQTQAIVARIPVPQPYGMDFSLDGSKLYVATATNFLYVIDPVKLQVVDRIDMSNWGGQGYTMVQPLALAGGKIGFLEYLDGPFNIWDPGDNSVVNAFGAWAAVRNKEGTKIAYNSETSPLTIGIYDVTTHANLWKGLSVGVTRVGGFHPTRNQFLTVGGSAGNTHAMLWDENLNVVQDYTTANGLETSGFFSRDGSMVYLEDGSVLDTNTFQLKGYVQFQDPSTYYLRMFVQDIDDSGLAIGMSHQGIVLIDTKNIFQQYRKIEPLYSSYSTPISGSLSGGTHFEGTAYTNTPRLGSLDGTTMYFGGRAASLVSAAYDNRITYSHINFAAMTPPNSPGVVDVAAYFPDGTMAMGASAFSYGPAIRNLTFTASTAEGGPAKIFGYGMKDGATITLGSGSSTGEAFQSGEVYTPSPSNRIEYTIPPGSPGKADLTLQTADGTRAYATAFQYYPAAQKYPLPGSALLMGIYDATRKLIYYTEADRVDVFSVGSKAWLPSITIPVASSPRKIRFAAMSPEAGYLAITDTANETLLIIDLASQTVQREVSVRPASPSYTVRLGTPLVFASETEVIVLAREQTHRIDVTTGTILWSKDAQYGSSTAYSRVVLDGSGRFLLMNEGKYLDLTEDTLIPHWWGCHGNYDDLAISSSGKISEGGCILNSDFLVTGQTYLTDAEYWSLEGSPVSVGGSRNGRIWDASGTFIIQPNFVGIDLINGRTGAVTERISTSLSIPDMTLPLVLVPEEQTLFLITTEGIGAIDLAKVPLALASLSPASGASGTQVEISGAGFDANTQISVDGHPVEGVLIDSNRLQFNAPEHANGPVQIRVTSSDGAQDFIDAAFVYGSSAPIRTAIDNSADAKGLRFRRVPTVVRAQKPQARFASKTQRGMVY